MASLETEQVEFVRQQAAVLHVMLIESANVTECQSNRHHTVNARLAANRARKAISAALLDMENAARLLDLARKES